MTKAPLVIDIYHGDEVTSFPDAFKAGVRGIIHKATTGRTGHDDAYAERRKAATRAGLLWGAYHWGTHVDVAKQVENFLKHAAPDDSTLVALDYESTPGNQMTLDQATEFLKLLGAEIGRKPVLYSGSTLKDALGTKKNSFLGSHRLWLAQYGPKAEVQASWSAYWLWQYTDGKKRPGTVHETVPGIPGNSKGDLDCNLYEGSETELAAEWAS